ncbi:MAG: glycosyltransferase family 4 protein [bacterium]|nr:glycosyltransferase family 4 protein [bacterium]
MKKVLIFSTAYLPYIGGAEMAVKEITDRLSDEIQFDLITLRFDSKLPKFEKLGNINVYRIGFSSNNPTMGDLVRWPLKLNKYLFPFTACFKACRLQRKNKYDGTWAMMAAFAGFAAMFFKIFHPGVPYLLTLQEGDPFEEIKRKVRFVRPLFKRIFLKADFIQVISSYLADFARELGYAGKLEIVPNGVDINKFKVESSKLKVEELKNKLGVFENDKIIITASRLVKKNAVDDIIKALEYLPENVIFLILGDGPDREKLEELVKQKNLSERTIFYGAYKNDDLPQYLAIADVFVRPSLSEGQGIAFLEAMAAGLPVIATRVGGIVDFLRDYETGLFCEVKNPKSIAAKVKIMLDNKKLAETVSNNAKNMIKKNYDWGLIAVKMKNIFKTITN